MISQNRHRELQWLEIVYRSMRVSSSRLQLCCAIGRKSPEKPVAFRQILVGLRHVSCKKDAEPHRKIPR
jgi:hypothetical protein